MIDAWHCCVCGSVRVVCLVLGFVFWVYRLCAGVLCLIFCFIGFVCWVYRLCVHCEGVCGGRVLGAGFSVGFSATHEKSVRQNNWM